MPRAHREGYYRHYANNDNKRASEPLTFSHAEELRSRDSATL